MKNKVLIILIILFHFNCSSDQGDVGEFCMPKIWYEDIDGDGFGNPNITRSACIQPEGYTDRKEEVDEGVEEFKFTPGLQEPFLINETNAGYGFYIYTPIEYKVGGENNFPLLIHLHGGGARGQGDAESTMKGVIFDGPPGLIKNNRWTPPEPMFVVTPQSPHLWDPKRLHDFITFLITNVDFDTSRIYMTGFSMGGRGVFDYVSAYGDSAYTAAVVPIAGWSIINNGAPFKSIPLWAFHGDSDSMVDVSGSINMVNAINSNNPSVKAKLTIFPKVNHFSWSRVYDNSGIGTEDTKYDAFEMTIYDWMLQYEKQSN